MPLIKLDAEDRKIFDRIATALEDISNAKVLEKSPGPYCCGCGTHCVYTKEKGYYCPKCDYYKKGGTTK